MALIESFAERVSEHPRRHDGVECGWQVFETTTGRILQLDTYGSSTRAIPGKISQSIQLDETAATTLLALIRRAFPGS